MKDYMKVTINGMLFTAQPIPARKANRLMIELGKQGVDIMGKLDSEAELSLTTLLPALTDIDVDVVDDLLDRLLESVSVDGTALDFDRVFMGQLDTAYMVAWEVIKFNFGDMPFMKSLLS